MGLGALSPDGLPEGVSDSLVGSGGFHVSDVEFDSEFEGGAGEVEVFSRVAVVFSVVEEQGEGCGVFEEGFDFFDVLVGEVSDFLVFVESEFGAEGVGEGVADAVDVGEADVEGFLAGDVGVGDSEEVLHGFVSLVSSFKNITVWGSFRGLVAVFWGLPLVAGEEVVFVFAFDFHEDAFGDGFFRVWHEPDAFFQVFEAGEGLFFSFFDDLPHVFFSDAGDEFDLVASRVDGLSSVKELEEFLFVVFDEFFDVLFCVELCCVGEFVEGDSADDVVDFVAFAFSHVDFFVGLEEDAFFRDEF